jgi:hypothetical protein
MREVSESASPEKKNSVFKLFLFVSVNTLGISADSAIRRIAEISRSEMSSLFWYVSDFGMSPFLILLVLYWTLIGSMPREAHLHVRWSGQLQMMYVSLPFFFLYKFQSLAFKFILYLDVVDPLSTWNLSNQQHRLGNRGMSQPILSRCFIDYFFC